MLESIFLNSEYSALINAYVFPSPIFSFSSLDSVGFLLHTDLFPGHANCCQSLSLEPCVGVVSEWSFPTVRSAVGTVGHLPPGADVLETTIAEGVLLPAAGTALALPS